MGKTVYALLAGQYEDRRLECIVSSKAKAERISAACVDEYNDHWQIEAWEVNPQIHIAPQGKLFYQFRTWQGEWEMIDDRVPVLICTEPDSIYPNPDRTDGQLMAWILASTEEGAERKFRRILAKHNASEATP